MSEDITGQQSGQPLALFEVADVASLAEDHPFINDMSDLEVVAALALHRTGCPQHAAKILDVAKKDIVSASRKRSVQDLLRVLVVSDLKTFGVKRAYDALAEVVDDPESTANARIRAAETLLKWSGELGGEADKRTARELSEMSVEELERTIHALEDQRDKALHNPKTPSKP